jgi:hypothetical protein
MTSGRLPLISAA